MLLLQLTVFITLISSISAFRNGVNNLPRYALTHTLKPSTNVVPKHFHTLVNSKFISGALSKTGKFDVSNSWTALFASPSTEHHLKKKSIISHIWDFLKSIFNVFNPFKTTKKSHSHHTHNTHQSHQNHEQIPADSKHHQPSTEHHSHQREIKADLVLNKTHHTVSHAEDSSKYMPTTTFTATNDHTHHENKHEQQPNHAATVPIQQHAIDLPPHHSPLLNDPIESSEKLFQAKKYAEAKLREIELYEKKEAGKEITHVTSSVGNSSGDSSTIHTDNKDHEVRGGTIRKLSLRSLPSESLTGKRVLVRYDLHIPSSSCNISQPSTSCTSSTRSYPTIDTLLTQDPTKLFQDLLPTLSYLLQQSCSSILLVTSYGPSSITGHYTPDYSLEALTSKLHFSLQEYTTKVMNTSSSNKPVLPHPPVKITFVPDSIGLARAAAIAHQSPGEVLFLENNQFYPEEVSPSTVLPSAVHSYLQAMVQGVDVYVQEGIHSLQGRESEKSTMSHIIMQPPHTDDNKGMKSVSGVLVEQMIETYNQQYSTHATGTAQEHDNSTRINLLPHHHELLFSPTTLPSAIKNLSDV